MVRVGVLLGRYLGLARGYHSMTSGPMGRQLLPRLLPSDGWWPFSVVDSWLRGVSRRVHDRSTRWSASILNVDG